MRLTKSQKEEFIVKVMKDVPRDKLNGLLKQAEQLVIEDALNDAPETIKNAWADPEANPWLSHGHCHLFIRCLTPPPGTKHPFGRS